MADRDTPPQVKAILAALPADGSFVGNGRVREATGLAPDLYRELTAAMRGAGYIATGRGRGGSSAITELGVRHLCGQASAGTHVPAPSPASAGQPTGRGNRGPKKRAQGGGEPLGFEATLWKAADKLRGSMDSSEYKHVVLGLVFLKYIDDAFTERRRQLIDDLDDEGITGEQGDELLESRSPDTDLSGPFADEGLHRQYALGALHTSDAVGGNTELDEPSGYVVCVRVHDNDRNLRPLQGAGQHVRNGESVRGNE